MQTSVLILRLTVLSLDRVRGIMEKDALKDPATNRSAANARLLLNEVWGGLAPSLKTVLGLGFRV
jgi:hypothetical protein